MALARFDTSFEVQSKTSIRQTGGGTSDTYATRFILIGSFTQATTRKVLDSGTFVNLTYYNLVYRYETDKAILISDKVLVNGIEYYPVGACTIDNIDHPRFYTQTLTIHE